MPLTRKRTKLGVRAVLASLVVQGLAVAEGEEAPSPVVPIATSTDPPVEPAPKSERATASDFDEDESDALLEAQLAAATQSAAPEEYSLTFYGFADFTYSAILGDNSQNFSKYSTFAVGNLNLYVDSQLGDRWRSLAEVRFMYLPHGTAAEDQLTDSSRFVAEAQDYADFGRTLEWGGIQIERAWLEYAFHELFQLRMGQWITPYGIWVVDHGSPVIMGITRPYVVGEGLFPERQTGLQAYGSHYLDRTKLGYHLTVSNGRGPIDAYQDLDANKGVGGRLFAEHAFDVGTLSVGASAYRGKYTDRSLALSVDEENRLSADNPATEAYDEVSYAVDVKWDQKELLAQAEGVMNEIAYEDGARPQAQVVLSGPPGFQPDWRRAGGYALVAYRSPLWGITPFLGGEYAHFGKQYVVPDGAAGWVGVNIRPTPRVVFKVQYTYGFFPTDSASEIIFDPIHFLSAQAAWSF